VEFFKISQTRGELWGFGWWGRFECCGMRGPTGEGGWILNCEGGIEPFVRGEGPQPREKVRREDRLGPAECLWDL